MPSHSIAVIAGDGVGPEVLQQAIRVTDAAVFASGESVLSWSTLPWSAAASLESGRFMPANGIRDLRSQDAVLFGPFGHPKLRDSSVISGFFQAVRRELDLSLCIRPVQNFEGISGSLHRNKTDPVDILFIHTLHEGEFADVGGAVHQHSDNEVAMQVQIWSRRGLERLFRYAFEQSAKRRKLVFAVRPPEPQRHAVTFWERALTEVSTDYPAVNERSASYTHAGIEILARPEHCDVVAGSGMAAALADFLAYGLGVLPLATRAEINPARTSPAFFGPMHGPAIEKTGMGLADPLASILASASLLEYLGLVRAPSMIRSAIQQILSKRKILSVDMGGKATTQQVADAIMQTFQ